MCVVSAVNDFGRQQWPEWEKPWPSAIPQVLPDPAAEVEKMRAFLDLLEKAKKIDKAAGVPNCEDPKKAVFAEAVERRLAAIEKMLRKLTAPKRKKKTGKRR
jgi:hypothetical protein